MFDVFAEILDLPTEIKTETEEVSPESEQTIIPLGNNWSNVEIKKENNQQQAGAELCQAHVKLGLAKHTEFVYHLINN